jgi:hypothetical protein
MRFTLLCLLIPGAAIGVLSAAGVTRADAPPGRYQVGTGTVYDNKTKLTWQQPVPDAGTWSPAASWSAARSTCAGGWRLPTLSELFTIVDFSQGAGAAAAMIDPSAFPNTPRGLFWTSTLTSSGTSAWVISFNSGASGGATAQFPTTNGTVYARCVK